MENLEIILKNKKIGIATICIIIIIIGGIWFINNEKDNNESIDIIENMEREMNKMDEKIENKNYLEGRGNNTETEESNEKEIIAIHITGEVKKTGIIYLEAGTRIADAIKKAGGANKNADLNQVNLAYILEDGQKIYIPNKKEKIHEGEYIVTNSGENVLKEESKNSKNNTNKDKNKTTSTSKNKKGVSGKVNINEANQTELETLEGIGPSLAERIIEYRKDNGKFEKIEEIQNVKGIGNSKYSNIKDKICI